MCLLDRIESWDADSIACMAVSHRDPENPLAENGMLPGLCAIEYAAQAMAVHGALTAATNGRPRAGYLASLRDVRCAVARLDDLAGELVIGAVQLIGGAPQVIYRFTVSCGQAALVTGRAAVVLEVMAP